MHVKYLGTAWPRGGTPEAAAVLIIIVSSYLLSGEPFLLNQKVLPRATTLILSTESLQWEGPHNLHFTDGETREGTCPWPHRSLWQGINQVEPMCNILLLPSPRALPAHSGNGPRPLICIIFGKIPRHSKAVFLLSSSALMPGIRKWGDGKCPV